MKDNNARKTRRQFPTELKWQIQKEGRSTNLTISQICEHYQISPTLFYQWERAAKCDARFALHDQSRGRKRLRPSEEALLQELVRLREVIAEITCENSQLEEGR